MKALVEKIGYMFVHQTNSIAKWSFSSNLLWLFKTGCIRNCKLHARYIRVFKHKAGCKKVFIRYKEFTLKCPLTTIICMNTELFQHYARQVNPLQWEIAMRIETVTSLRPWQIISQDFTLAWATLFILYYGFNSLFLSLGKLWNAT